MLVASIERTAYPRFKWFLSARELRVFYTPQPEEIAWAREVASLDEHLLALTVQLRAFGRLGYFRRLVEGSVIAGRADDQAVKISRFGLICSL